ncbi:hypothetical protein CGCVW01_v005367, partial [Colletotrichum viniferum]
TIFTTSITTTLKVVIVLLSLLEKKSIISISFEVNALSLRTVINLKKYCSSVAY